ncbi:hypothetical protein R6Q57_007153 [Mikania cordata]
MDTQPLPIIHPFGQESLYSEFTDGYYNQDGKVSCLMGRKEVIYMANFCAFQFWQHTFQDNLRLERLKHILKFDETTDIQFASLKIEEEWCMFHNLVQSSLLHIASIYENVLNSVHRYRPNFLATSNGLPSYYEPYEFQHTCLLTVDHNDDSEPLTTDDDPGNSFYETKKCIALPFVDANGFKKNEVAFRLANSIKEIKICYLEDPSGNQQTQNLVSYKWSRSFSLSENVSLPNSKNKSCAAEDVPVDASLLLNLFPSPDDSCLLLFDDFDIQFSSNIAHFYNPSSIICTTSAVKFLENPFLQDLRIVWGLSHPHGTIISKAANNSIPWEEVKCVVWIPKFGNDVENWEEQKGLIKTFFEYLAIRILGDALYEVQLILVLNNQRFAQLQVESVGGENFFHLRESFPFDEYSFGRLSDDIVATKKNPMLASKPVVYAFDLHPPTDIQFGDYTSLLHNQLHNTT